MDLSAGVYQFEADPAAAPAVPSAKTTQPAAVAKVRAKGPAISASPPATAEPSAEEKYKACPPGRQCGLFFPEQMKKKAVDSLKKKVPGIDVR
jgi:hypothetical protein